MLTQTEIKNSLIKEIHQVFGDVPFPDHIGWNAAIAMDDWIEDPVELRKITEQKDIKGKWWDIPQEELSNCSLAQCYLDKYGVEFYLPACLVIVLNDTTYIKYIDLIYWLLPPNKNKDYGLYTYFLEKFSKIDKPHKNICIKVIQYIKNYSLSTVDRLFLMQDIETILNHDFWVSKM